MEEKMIEMMRDGIETAFINSSKISNLAYKPQFVSNDYRQGKKVLTSIEDELLACDEFCISVAFITMSGLVPLLQTLKELEQRNVRGRILTTDYLNFSEPKALEKLDGYSNIDVRMYCADKGDAGFHTKGYIFRNGEIYRMIIGSSNMTRSALSTNKEWNTRIISTEQGDFAEQVKAEFDSLWSSEKTRPLADILDRYAERYEIIRKQRKVAEESAVVSLSQYRLEPNVMQVEFSRNLKRLVEDGAGRALLISATGTGKTYASAFALRDENPEKFLFLVHREQIAKQAMASYKTVFGDSCNFGLLAGDSKDYDAEYLFSTMQMMAKQETLDRYKEDEFDIIVIDEVHRAGAESYQRIIDHFKPKLLLGMTASPERTDDFDIFGLFDHNIAYEIRLQQALEENLLCPFHYFGITDLLVDGVSVDDNRKFSYLVSDDRVSHIIKEAEYYGYSGDRVKGLIFCSRRDEAEELSNKFNVRGYRTDFICGSDSQEKRENCIERLVSDDDRDHLDYLFTIDLLNEGADMPPINQIILLRPTESPIIFVQQLGRGLRKFENKEYVVVMDFIGNYANNFMIPIALSGDRSYNKDNMRKYVSGGTRIIPGSSSIHFDEIARKQIYASIDSAKTNEMSLLKKSYLDLKYKLGRVPGLMDFREHDAIDVSKIFDKCGSYYAFLKKFEKDYKVQLSPEEASVIQFISQKIASGKRVHELEMLNILLNRNERLVYYFEKLMQEKFGIGLSEEEVESTVINLTNRFGRDTEQKKFSHCVFLTASGSDYGISPEFKAMLSNKDFYDMVRELVDYGMAKYELDYADRYGNTSFKLYQKYTYEDVCRLLNWQRNMNAQNIGGYFYDKSTGTLPVFINYEKSEGAIAYEDRFISNNELVALSKHPRKITSSDADHIYRRRDEDKQNRIYLFVRKNKDDNESKEFYFLGEINAVDEPVPIRMKTPKGKEDNAFEINYRLDVPVREDVYDYIVEDA